MTHSIFFNIAEIAKYVNFRPLSVKIFFKSNDRIDHKG